jgi:hypothetical protein
MSQPTQRLSGSLELKIDQWTKSLNTAKQQYDAWKASITPINVPPINAGGAGSGTGGSPSSGNVPKLRTDLAALRAEMALAVAQTKLLGTGYDQLGLTLNKVRSEAISLSKTQGAAASDVASAMKLALEATNSLGQIGGVSEGAKLRLKDLTAQANLLRVELGQIGKNSAPADLQKLEARAAQLNVAFAALRPSVEQDVGAITQLSAAAAALDKNLLAAQNRLNAVNNAATANQNSASGLEKAYAKLQGILAVVGLEKFARFARDAALDNAKLTNGIVIFGKTLETNGQSIDKGSQLVDALSKRFRVLPDDIRGSVAELVRAGASLEQVNTLLTGGAASGLAKQGSSAKQGIEGVTAAVISGSSAMLAQIGITENLGPATDRYAKALGKTSDELSNFERIQAATNLVSMATVQEAKNVEDAFQGLVGDYADAEKAARGAELALGKVVTPAVIEFTKTYASVLGLVTQALQGIQGGPKADQNAGEQRLSALTTQAKDLQAQVDQLNKDGGFWKFLRLGNTQQALDFVNAEITKTKRGLAEIAANQQRVNDLANLPASQKTTADAITTTTKGLEKIDKLQEKIASNEVRAIPDTEARKIAKARADFEAILETINALRKSDPGLSSQLDALEKRAKAVQSTEIAAIRADAAKARVEEAQKRADAAQQDAGVAAQAEKSANAARIAAMKDGTAKIKAEYAERQRELSVALTKDLEDVKGNEQATARVRAAYKTERAALRTQELQDLNAFATQSRQVVIDAERALETARVGAMKEGSAKIRAQYQLERADLEQKLADDLAKVSGNQQAEARVRAAFAGQLAALRIKAENDISKVEAEAAKKRADAQKALNRDIIDQELRLATDRAAATGSKTEIEQARYTKQLTDLERFLNDQRAKYKDNAEALAKINALGYQQRELAEREHQQNILKIQADAKTERVQARATKALTGLGDLDQTSIVGVRTELERLRRDSAGNAAGLKIVEDAFDKLNGRAKALSDQAKKSTEDVATFRAGLDSSFAAASKATNPVEDAKAQSAALLIQTSRFFNEQRAMVKGNKDALLRLDIEEAQAKLQIAKGATDERLAREKDLNAEILAGSKSLAIEQAKLSGNDAGALALETQQAIDATREKYRKLVELADGNADMLIALRRNEEGEISQIRQKASNDRFRLFEAEIERSKAYLRLLADNASELARGRAQLNADPLAELEAESATRKRSLAERFAVEIVTRKKAGLDTLELEKQLNEALLQEDQRTSKARITIFKAEAETRKQIQGIVQAAENAAAQAIVDNSDDPFQKAYARLRSNLKSIDDKLKEDLEKVGADTAAQAALKNAANSRAKSAFTAYNKEIVELEKQRAEAILAIDRGLQNDRLEVLKRTAALTASPFDDIVTEVQSQLVALDTALDTFLKDEKLNDEQRTAARTINAQKRTLVLVEAARKQVEAEQQIVNAGLEELNFLRSTASAVLTESQAREFNLATLKAEILARNTNIASLERQVRVGAATGEQLKTAKRGAIQAELEYASTIKASIVALETQAKTVGVLGDAIVQVSGVLNQPVPQVAIDNNVRYANALAESANQAVKTGASLEEITQKALESSAAFSKAGQAAATQFNQEFQSISDLSDKVLGGANDPRVLDRLRVLSSQIAKTFNVPLEDTFRSLQNGLVAGSKQLDFSKLTVRGSEALQPIQDFLVNAAEKSPETLAKIRTTIESLEKDLTRVQDGIIAALKLENVQDVITTTAEGIVSRLEDTVKPFANSLGAELATAMSAGFQKAFKTLTNELQVPPLKIDLFPQLNALSAGSRGNLGGGGGSVTNITYNIDGKTIANAPLDVREALAKLKRFAEQETQAGTAVPQK